MVPLTLGNVICRADNKLPNVADLINCVLNVYISDTHLWCNGCTKASDSMTYSGQV